MGVGAAASGRRHHGTVTKLDADGKRAVITLPANAPGRVSQPSTG
jgi:hypothetical protein